MLVRTYHDELRVSLMAFEARFDDGYRYLDSCGEAFSKIRNHDRKWKSGDINPQSGNFVNTEKLLQAAFSTEKFGISRLREEPLDKPSADKISDDLASEADYIYRVVTDTFEIPNTTRVGVRFGFIALADSLEDAERFLVRATKSPLDEEVEKITSSQMYTSTIRVSAEDGVTGHRRNISIYTVRISDRDSPATGLGGEEDKVKSGIVVDIDTFTRPSSGHFLESRLFIANAYSRSFSHAKQLFDWLTKKQGTK